MSACKARTAKQGPGRGAYLATGAFQARNETRPPPGGVAAGFGKRAIRMPKKVGVHLLRVSRLMDESCGSVHRFIRTAIEQSNW